MNMKTDPRSRLEQIQKSDSSYRVQEVCLRNESRKFK